MPHASPSILFFTVLCAFVTDGAAQTHLRGRIVSRPSAEAVPWTVYALSPSGSVLQAASRARGAFRIEIPEAERARTWRLWAVRENEGAHDGSYRVTEVSRIVRSGVSVRLYESTERYHRVRVPLIGHRAWAKHGLHEYKLRAEIDGRFRFARTMEVELDAKGREYVEIPAMPPSSLRILAQRPSGVTAQSARIDARLLDPPVAQRFPIYAPRAHTLLFTARGMPVDGAEVYLSPMRDGDAALTRTSRGGQAKFVLPSLAVAPRRFTLRWRGMRFDALRPMRFGERWRASIARESWIAVPACEAPKDAQLFAVPATGFRALMRPVGAPRRAVCLTEKTDRARPPGLWLKLPRSELLRADPKAPLAEFAYLGRGMTYGSFRAIPAKRRVVKLREIEVRVRSESGAVAKCPTIYVRTTRGGIRSFVGSSRGRLRIRANIDEFDAIFAQWDASITKPLSFKEIDGPLVELEGVPTRLVRGRVVTPPGKTVRGLELMASLASVEGFAGVVVARPGLGAWRGIVGQKGCRALARAVSSRRLRVEADGSFEMSLGFVDELWAFTAWGSVDGKRFQAKSTGRLDALSKSEIVLRLEEYKVPAVLDRNRGAIRNPLLGQPIRR